MPGDHDDVKPDWTISHGLPDELRTTIGEQLESRRSAERGPEAPAPERADRRVGNTIGPVHPGDGGEEA